MDDHFYMYQDSFRGLYRQDYLKEIESFINFILYNMKNFSGDKINIYMQSIKIKNSTIKIL
jgi:hypothetical protein